MLEFPALPAISPEIAALLNRLVGSRWIVPPRGEAHGRAPALNVYFTHPPMDEGTRVELEVTADFGTIRLRPEPALVDFLSDFLLPGWRDEADDSLPTEWRAVIVLEAFLPAMAFERVVKVDTRLGAASPRVAGPLLETLRAVVAVGSHQFHMSLAFSGFEDGRVTEILRLCSHGPIGDFDPGFCCRLHLPGRTVTSAVYSTLKAGDALLAGAIEGGRLPVAIEVPDIARFTAKLDISTGAAEIFESAESIIMNEIDSDWSEFGAGAIYDEPPLADPIEDLPVRLDFLFSTQRITLEELRALGPGATLRLNVDLTRPVTILANGAPAGRGYLVQIGDHMGVQLSHWAGTKHNDGG
jgi:type III secretion protein Q